MKVDEVNHLPNYFNSCKIYGHFNRLCLEISLIYLLGDLKLCSIFNNVLARDGEIIFEVVFLLCKISSEVK